MLYIPEIKLEVRTIYGYDLTSVMCVVGGLRIALADEGPMCPERMSGQLWWQVE